MAGLSSRFFRAGYEVPKYALQLRGRTVFDWAVLSFKRYFITEEFVFVVRDDGFAPNFVKIAVDRLGIERYDIIRLDADTRGQAETAYLAVRGRALDFPLTIFNIDTIRHDFRYPSFVDDCDGYLEVFKGEGSHWSFIEPGADSTVKRATEKVRISDLCSDGLYYFGSQLQYQEIFEEAVRRNETAAGEFYVAPLYNILIERGGNVKYEIIEIDEIDFCGTPEEYVHLLENMRLL